MKRVKLSDYKPYPFKIPSINLDFNIYESDVIVTSLMQIIPDNSAEFPLILKGREIELIEIRINDVKIDKNHYILNEYELIIDNYPVGPFNLLIISRINPFSNTSLEGLYLSSNILTTQCEAEGFRRITFHPDRPDVLSKYKVRIESDIKTYPILLSNGNKVTSGLIKDNNLRHEYFWNDPFPKPSYLFALVAGDLKLVNGVYKTRSGRSIDIHLYVEKGDEKYTEHALKSLKKAMKWDEDVYGLEYDLDLYMIVAIRHFNMGAMENKGLNIFNSKLILADTQIATDSELERIESVIAHEYFHNWTGNRITCRDWFQLSLKEGLTVFRDQSFTSDMHSSALKRIEDVSLLRSIQFSEDSGPTSHAVKPKDYVSIDNFYTTTIYEKGAELIRMLKLLLGEKDFIHGVKFYLSHFDGQAVTTEDFIYAVTKGTDNGPKKIEYNVNQFQNWYYQAGTPLVFVRQSWNKEEGILTLSFKQEKTTNKKETTAYLPMVIPITYKYFFPESNLGSQNEEKLFILDKLEKELKLTSLPRQEKSPIISLMRGFSAPVNINSDKSVDDYLFLLANDDDYFSRWDSGQFLMCEAIKNRINNQPDLDLENSLIKALRESILYFGNRDNSFLASLLKIPETSQLENLFEEIDPIALYNARLEFNKTIGNKLSIPLKDLLDDIRKSWNLIWPEGKGERQLTEVIWSLLALNEDPDVLKEAIKAIESNSMTLARSALSALQPIKCIERKKASDIFYKRWENNPVVLDAWFAYEASTPNANSIEFIKSLLVHPRFDPMAPNSIRAVLGGFSRNILSFHSKDGSGYEFLAEKIFEVDKINPITASRLAKIFIKWRNYINPNKLFMKEALENMNKLPLSSNSKEVIALILS